MFVKLPLEVEIPDTLNVGSIELSCEQINDYFVRYDRADRQDMFPYITIDLAEGKITGYIFQDDIEDSFNVTGDGLYEALINMAENLTQLAKKRDNAWTKSTKKSKDVPKFSDMVKKQRDKSLAKTDETSLATFFEGIYSEIGDIADRIKEVNNSNSKDSGIYYKIDNIRTTLIHSIQAQIEDLMGRL